IAGFIFGKNKNAGNVPESISMTAPVSFERERPGLFSLVGGASPTKGRVSFMMPGKFTPETLPRPDSRAVSFRTVRLLKSFIVHNAFVKD
ncbi:hypothetical protein T484DRAFT_1829526, partial [Baffinella frigidus]